MPSQTIALEKTHWHSQPRTIIRQNGAELIAPSNAFTLKDPGYKSLQVRDEALLSGNEDGLDQGVPPVYANYGNTGVSDTSDSVKYYILEEQNNKG